MDLRLSWRGSSFNSSAVLRVQNFLNISLHTFITRNTKLLAESMFVSDDLQQRWWNLEAKLAGRFKKKPDLEAILFLIGIQEFGQIREKFTKEQKQDLMHVAVCKLLSQR